MVIQLNIPKRPVAVPVPQRHNLLIHPAMTQAQVRFFLNGRRLVARPEPKDAA